MDRLAPVMDAPPARLEHLPSTSRLSAEAEKLAARIERAVRRGTNDKVRDLRVEIADEGILLQGRCGTYYCKQLAQHAAIALAKPEVVINQIEVR